MKEYSQFVDKLRIELKTFQSEPKELWSEVATKYVNGLAADELRRLINIDIRRQNGAFFTNNILANKVFEYLKPSFNSNSFIYDPACGAGNLLISVSSYIYEKLGIPFNLENQLLGTDIHQEFIEASRLRLETNYLLNCSKWSLPKNGGRNLDKHSMKVADGLSKNEFYEKATDIIVNPPFNLITPTDTIKWSKGKISAAALFIDKIIQNSNPGVSIIAILPDVLRSGTRYDKWRKMVKNECTINKTKLLGQFDKYADVDVFAISLTKKETHQDKSIHAKSVLKVVDPNSKKTINDLFDVCVGPVVDNRDKHTGPKRSYVVSKGLEGWSVKKEVILKRKHNGKAFEGPFVVIKRTSRMGDLNRAVSTIINVPKPVYVDNHLIILKPKSGNITDCRNVLKILKDNRTNNWLNQEIRCRHLTVKVISKIPLWDEV